MNTRSRFASFAVVSALLMSVSGCVCVTGGGGTRGDVTMLWNFNGQTCATIPDVAKITIQIPGQTLDNQGVYACATNGTAGITLLDFRAGTYTYEIQARNSSDSILYSASGKFVVNGDVTVNVTMQANTNAPGGMYLTWTFPPSSVSNGGPASCAQTSGPVAGVYVSIDGAQGQEYPCTAGQTSPGLYFANLLSGTHSIDVAAHDANGYYYYRNQSNFTVIAGTAASQQLTLGWYVGSLPIKWSFSNNTSQLTCGMAGVQKVYINLRGPDGNLVYAEPGVAVDCLNSGVQGTVFDYLYAGNYTVLLSATGTAGYYYSSSTNLTTVAVTAGIFPRLDGSTQVVPMALQ